MKIGHLEIADRGFVVILSRSNRDAREKWYALNPTRGVVDLPLSERRAAYARVPIFLPDFGDGVYYEEVAAAMEKDAAAAPARVVTTQNPTVFDHLAFEFAAGVRQRVLVVRGGRLENITGDEALLVWAAMEVGVQHVHEIFKTQGLW